ncbi:type I methionyl aminopeptidase [Candidatus Vallotiella sp. (ex Adelges kitamiensis)]|uniref:type I methionyl aminopeptidase n=1 Tax=Candidatus Vallotiella sp. (ex Adelges kitamiensis) TaxID=2864217 RepID=UPI001CE31584|nr:type I methionyl aminopeptidase [Candidatus Vallotia sp. (ex Adelges kitamiensis)]
MPVIIKNEYDIAKMRIACRLASEVLDYITPFIKPDITTSELDKLCYEYMLYQQHTVPAPLNYQPFGYPPYPKATCISVNDVVCHGIPSNKKLKNNDILNIDITVIKDGYFGDTSRMFIVNSGSILCNRLVQVTYECMWLGIDQVRPSAHLGDIGYAIQHHAEAHGYSVVREYCGHGIGNVFHEEPQILHYGHPSTGMQIQPGMIFTIEPMINAGRREIRTMSDQWTVRTRDHSLSAQWEHTVLVTQTGYEVLTISANTPAKPMIITECV